MINAQSKQPTNSTANGDLSSFFSQMGTGPRQNSTPAPSHAHGSNSNSQNPQTRNLRLPSQQAPPRNPLSQNISNNANDLNDFFSQMGTTSRQPPTAPAVMRANGSVPAPGTTTVLGNDGGVTKYGTGSVQCRPVSNVFAATNAKKKDEGKVYGAPKVATSLPGGWWK